MSMSRIRTLLTGWILFLSGSLAAQQVLNVAGTQSDAAGITLQYSIGELLVRTTGPENIQLTEGVIQPIGSLPTSANRTALRQKIEVFPNPAFGYVHLRTPARHSIEYSLISGSGQLVLSGRLPDGSGIISVRHLPDGWYIAHLKGLTRSYDSVKIILRSK